MLYRIRFLRPNVALLCSSSSCLELSNLDLPALFEWQVYLLPQLTSLAQMVCQVGVMHTRILFSTHRLELGDDVLQTEGFPSRLGAARFEGDVNNVNVEVVVRWLV
jgi:hypothetical protein